MKEIKTAQLLRWWSSPNFDETLKLKEEEKTMNSWNLILS